MNYKNYIKILWFIRFFYKIFMIVFILMNLYYKNLKNLKGLYKFIKFESIIWISKNTFKIIRVGKKNDEILIKKKEVKLIQFFNLLIATLFLSLSPLILILLTIASSHSCFWIWTIDLKLYINFLFFWIITIISW